MTVNNTIFNTTYPFHKIDMANPVGFTTIELTFNTETPNPEEPTTTSTRSEELVYQFAHGYNYMPSIWTQVSSNSIGWSYLASGGALPLSTYAKFQSRVDETYVYFYVTKQWGRVFGVNDDISDAYVQGMTVSIRCNIFVEDLTGTMV